MLMILLQILHNSNCAVMDPTRNGKLPLSEGLLENILLKFYLFVAMLCLCCCAQAFSSCRTRASHCGGFSCCRALALGYRGFSSCGVRALLPCGRWNLPRPGIKPVFPALDGWFLTTGLTGKSVGPSTSPNKIRVCLSVSLQVSGGFGVLILAYVSNI